MLILAGRSIGAEIEHNNAQGNHGSIEMRFFLRVCQMSKIRINHKQFLKTTKPQAWTLNTSLH